MNPTKTRICDLLRAWVNQRPGLEFGNYGDWKAYRAELRQITKDRAHALTLLRAVELRESITAADLVAAFPRAYSGRLSLVTRYRVNGKGGTFASLEEAQARAAKYAPSIVAIEALPALDYCAGQYWPTEYRCAACAVLASVLWDWVRGKAMPAPCGRIRRATGRGPFAHESEHDSIEGLTPGDWLRRHFRREFGRGIQASWFN